MRRCGRSGEARGDGAAVRVQRGGRGGAGAAGQERERFARLAAALDALSPLKVLGRGYAIPRREDGTVLRSARGARAGEKLALRLCDGEVSCEVMQSVR